MDVRQEDTSGEIRHLKRCLNDLVSVLALPAMWSGSQPSQIVHTLLDALLGMLCLDLVYARFEDPAGGAPSEVLKIAPSAKWMLPDEIHKNVNQWFGDDPQKWPSRLRASIGDEDISIVSQRCGLHGEIGVIVAGSQRADFPGRTETLVLSVAANQAVIGLQEARLLSEQKRVASDLDRRVAERTKELAETEEALRASERELSSIINTIPMLAWSARPDGFCDFLNQRWLDFTGLSEDQACGWGWGATIHPDEAKGLLDSWQMALVTGQLADVEARMRRFDGEYRWCLLRARPLRDESGKIVRWYGTNTDIDDRKRAEEELQRSEAFLGEGQRLTLSGSLLWRLDTDEITFSDQLYRIHEFDRDSPVTLERIRSRIHPEDLPLLSKKIEQARADGHGVLEIRL